MQLIFYMLTTRQTTGNMLLASERKHERFFSRARDDIETCADTPRDIASWVRVPSPRHDRGAQRLSPPKAISLTASSTPFRFEHAAQRPLNFGLRFSLKAVTPSRRSSVGTIRL